MTNDPRSAYQERTLYRKYRPQRFADVLGQDHVVTILTNALREGQLAHALLFAGPRGTGKTTIARLLARRLNCEHPAGPEPCDTCSCCVASQQNVHLDVIEIDAASNRGIDEIRALKERIVLAPSAGAFKVYIVDEVHMLTKEAFNALLKTLEEPPTHAVFILATTELHKVPDTIRSRCQTFLFRRAPVALITQRLAAIAKKEELVLEPTALLLIAQHSEGCFRDAESLLGQVLALHTDDQPVTALVVERALGMTSIETTQSFAEALFERAAHPALTALHAVMDRGASVRAFADDLTRYLRAVASMAIASVHSESYPPTIETRLREHAARYRDQDLVALVRVFLRAKTEMRDTAYDALPLEVAILEWCGPGKDDGRPPAREDAGRRPVVGEARSVQWSPEKVDERSQETSSASRGPAASSRVREEGTENPLLYERVLEVWPAFLEKSTTLNPLLLSTLEACVPVAVTDTTLHLVTQYTLYRDRIRDRVVRTPLEDALELLTGTRLVLSVLHGTEAKARGIPESSTRAEEMAAARRATHQERNLTVDALATLGGELLGQSSSSS